MFVTETSINGTSELTVQIDISMPNLASTAPNNNEDLTNNNRIRYYSNSSLKRSNEKLHTMENNSLNNNNNKNILINNNLNKKVSVYHRRCTIGSDGGAINNGTIEDDNYGSDPALSPSASHNSSYLRKKQPFITVVKSGKFLDPPPSGDYYNNGTTSLYKNNKQNEQILVYSYSSKPRVMPSNYHKQQNNQKINNNTYYNTKTLLTSYNTRNKRSTTSDIYQHDGGTNPYGNIMSDKRVVRGSNFSQHPPTTQPKWNPYFGYARLLSQPAERQEEQRRRAAARRRARPKAFRRLGTPPPVDGRRHTEIQTEGRYEEILERNGETETACQTDTWEKFTPVPYIPVKSSTDRETQVLPGELFDFDREAQPVVSRVVGRAVEQALAEVLQEEEVAGLRAQQRRLHELRLAEWAEARRIAERENRLQKEKETRTKEHETAAQDHRRAEERAAAAALSQAMLEELLPPILVGLQETDQIPDTVKQEVSTGLMPWLVEEVAQEMRQMITSRHVLTDIVREVLETRAELTKVMSGDTDAENDEIEPETESDDEINAAAKSETTSQNQN